MENTCNNDEPAMITDVSECWGRNTAVAWNHKKTRPVEVAHDRLFGKTGTVAELARLAEVAADECLATISIRTRSKDLITVTPARW